MIKGDIYMSIRVFWAGDSTVKENTIVSFPQTGIGQVLRLFLKRDILVYDYAQNGRSTKSFIDEGRLDIIDSNIKENDFLFIQFGHNDEKIEDPLRYTEAFGEYQDNLKKYINVARKHKAIPVLITPLYRRLFINDTELDPNTHGEYPKACIEVGQMEGVPVIDLCSISKAVIEKAGKEESKKWFLHVPAGVYPHFPDGKEDNSHLQYEGAVRFAKIIYEEMMKLGTPYSSIFLESMEDDEDPRMLID